MSLTIFCSAVTSNTTYFDEHLPELLENVPTAEVLYFDSYASAIQRVSSITTDWYLLLFSNETLSSELCEALPLLLEDLSNDAFYFYKALSETQYLLTPRLCRKYVQLKENELSIISALYRSTSILDGWIKEHNGIIFPHIQS